MEGAEDKIINVTVSDGGSFSKFDRLIGIGLEVVQNGTALFASGSRSNVVLEADGTVVIQNGAEDNTEEDTLSGTSVVDGLVKNIRVSGLLKGDGRIDGELSVEDGAIDATGPWAPFLRAA